MRSRNSIFSGFFQLGYVTRNVEVASKEFTRKFGTKFQIFDLEKSYKDILQIERVAFGRAGSTVIKIIEPLTGDSIFSKEMVENPRVVRLHHLGYLIKDYEKILRKLKLDPLEFDIPLSGRIKNLQTFCYADTRNSTGLYTEFVCLEKLGEEFFTKL